MLKHTPCDTHRHTGGWHRRGNIRMEYRSHDLDYQHEYGWHLFRNCDGYQGLHGLRFWYVNRQSESHSLS